MLVVRWILLGGWILLLGGCEGVNAPRPLPQATPEAVVKQFYEYIAEAGIRGGTLPLKEAYKSVSPATKMSEQRFNDIVRKYPPGFLVEIDKTLVKPDERRAVVTIAYRMASLFGPGYVVKTDIPLLVDEESLTWKIDFTGESDDQDPAVLKQSASREAK